MDLEDPSKKSVIVGGCSRTGLADASTHYSRCVRNNSGCNFFQYDY